MFEGVDFIWLIGGAVIAIGAAALIGIIIGAVLVMLFLRTHKLFIPRFTLMLISTLEVPIKYLLALLRVDMKTATGQDMIDLMIARINNLLYKNAFSKVPMKKRAIFMPQCLRHKDCPAKTGHDGIMCVGCGKCGLATLKKFAGSLGYMFFIVPGGSFVRRLMKKYSPKAIVGVGCNTEIKEGTRLVVNAGIPVQGVPLTRDGCISTTADFEEIKKTMLLGSD